MGSLRPQTSLYTRRQMLRGMLLTGAGVALAACTGGATRTSPSPGATIRKVAPGGVLRVGDGAGAATEGLDPATTGNRHTQTFAVYDQLTWLTPDLRVEPNLAESWTSNEELTEWVFKLRQGVTWHDSKPFTADDVIHSYRRMLDEKTGSVHALVMAAIDPDGITAEDDFTVKLRLNFPMWDLAEQAASNFASIVPAHVPAESLATKPVGTGPFIFKEYIPGERFVATKNPNYWKRGFPLLDEIRIFYVEDVAARINGVRTGQYDLIAELTPVDARTVEGTAGVEVLSTQSGRFVAFAMNTAVAPFGDLRVRKAFKLVQDRQKMLDEALQGQGALGNDQPVPPISPIWGDLPIPPRDVDQARALLAEAGFPNGLDVDLYTGELIGGQNRLAVLFKEDAEAAGIRVNVKQQDLNTFYQVYSGPPFTTPMWTEGYNFRPAGATFNMCCLEKSVWNWFGFSDPAFEQALVAARSEADPALRVEKYAEAEALFAEVGHLGLPVFIDIIEAASTKLGGYATHPMGYVRDYRAMGFVE